MADSRTGTGNIEVKPEDLEHLVETENKSVLEKGWGMSKGHGSQLKGASNGQSQDNLNN